MGFASAVVVDPQGKVLAASGEGAESGPLEGPGVERTPLPGGGFLITRPIPPDNAWSRFSHAFVHEARSPLNALAIYLELLGTRLATARPGERPEAAPDRMLGKANEQIRRIEELLRNFGELWGARGQNADLAELTRAACRFCEHEALRHGMRLTHSICPTAIIPNAPVHVADAIVALLGGAMRARSEVNIQVTLAVDGGHTARLGVELIGGADVAVDILQPGLNAFRLLGGRTGINVRSASVIFPLVRS